MKCAKCSRMANSVKPDQSAPEGRLIWVNSVTVNRVAYSFMNMHVLGNSEFC